MRIVNGLQDCWHLVYRISPYCQIVPRAASSVLLCPYNPCENSQASARLQASSLAYIPPTVKPSLTQQALCHCYPAIHTVVVHCYACQMVGRFFLPLCGWNSGISGFAITPYGLGGSELRLHAPQFHYIVSLLEIAFNHSLHIHSGTEKLK